MFDHELHNPTKDAPITQVISFDDNSITLARIEPFGFIKLTLAKGILPERYCGMFTSFALAEHAAQEYIEQNSTCKGADKKEPSAKAKSDSDRKQLH